MKRLIQLSVIALVLSLVALAGATSLTPNPKFTALDSNGDPQVGASLYTYETGTTTPKTTWTDSTKATPNPNPIILDSYGQANVWIDSSGGAYRLKLLDATGATVWTVDGIEDLQSAPFSSLGTITNPVKADQFVMKDGADGTIKTLDVEYLNGNVYYPDPDEADQGTYVAGTIKYYADEIGSDDATIVLRHNSGAATTEYTIGSNLDLSSNSGIQFEIERGAILSITSGLTLTIYSPANIIAAPNQQIFDVNGDVVFSNGGTIYSPWFATTQEAIDSAAEYSIIDLAGTYDRPSRVAGINDKWGLNIQTSNIIFQNGKIRRNDTDISTYALAYAPLFIGVPDSNVAAATENVTIRDIEFVGEDTRHAVSGGILTDKRYAIEIKNSKGVKIYNNKFTLIDSSAILIQKPDAYDYDNSAYYNTTKCYNIDINHNKFIAESHAVDGRALLHAISITGADDVSITDNYFEWCDDAVSGGATYDDLNDIETDTFVGSGGFAVKRSGRTWNISNNKVYNSSEHAFYVGGQNMTISNNIIWTDLPSVCISDIKIYGRGVSITGNSITARLGCVQIRDSAFNVSATGNSFVALTAAASSVVSIANYGILAFITARPFLTTLYKMSNIIVSGNSISLNPAATAGTVDQAFSIITDTSSVAGYEFETMANVSIVNNTIENHKVGVYCGTVLAKNVTISNNSFYAKPFVITAFDNTTVMNTLAILQVPDAYAFNLMHVNFSNNRVYGADYLFSSVSGGGASLYLPKLVDGNDFYYLKNFSTTDFREIAALNLWGDNSFRYSLNGGTAAIIGIDQTLSIDYAGAAADRTLTTVERSMKYISVSNASGAVNLYHGAAPYGHQWVIYNASGFTLTFKQSAGATGISIPNGQVGIAVQGRSDCHQVSVKAE